MLVIAAGIRPNVGLVQRAGLTVEPAIVTDDHMPSVDDEDVYVVGECAQQRGQVYSLVAPLWEQARVLADHITETDSGAAYHGSRTATSSSSPASTSRRWVSKPPKQTTTNPPQLIVTADSASGLEVDPADGSGSRDSPFARTGRGLAQAIRPWAQVLRPNRSQSPPVRWSKAHSRAQPRNQAWEAAISILMCER